jgi:hypothetical protein
VVKGASVMFIAGGQENLATFAQLAQQQVQLRKTEGCSAPSKA